MPIIPSYYEKWQCSNCQTIQKFHVGDPNDLTYLDPEAVKCFSCGKVELIDLDVFTIMHGYDEDGNLLEITEELIKSSAIIEDGEPI